jgi:hypothetical protein
MIIISWVLFVPLVIDVDTDHFVYRIYQRGSFAFSLSPEFQPQLKLLGFRVPIKSQREKEKKVKGVKEKSKKKSNYFNRYLTPFIKRIFKSIQFKKFWIDMDTDDVVLNSQLVPVFFFMNHGPVQLNVNYSGRMSVQIIAQIRINEIVWAFLIFITKTKYYGNEF